MSTPDRVLITGGAGFIGSHLADLLVTRGTPVLALDDLSTGSRANFEHHLGNPLHEFVQGSILDAALVDDLTARCGSVYHLAAAVGVRLIVERPLESLMTNIKGTEHVVEAAHRHGRKLLVASTSEIYGKSLNGAFKEDDDRLLGPNQKMRWSYATSKSVDEILALTYHRQFGLPTIVVRLFNTVGPRQSAQYGMVLPRFIEQALGGRPLTVYGDGTQSRVFTYVADVVEALTRLMGAPEAVGDVFNVAGAEEITIEALAARVIARTGSSSTIAHLSFEEVYGADFDDMQRRVADTTKLARVTGYRCLTPLDQTIERMIDAVRSRTGG